MGVGPSPDKKLETTCSQCHADFYYWDTGPDDPPEWCFDCCQKDGKGCCVRVEHGACVECGVLKTNPKPPKVIKPIWRTKS